MDSTIRILLQTTTPARADDWSVDSLTLLRGHLAGLSEEGVRFEVTARNRDTPAGAPHPVLSRLAHHFQTKNPEPDTSRRVRDDAETRDISWPNYHSGSNGGFQRIVRLEPAHELLRNSESPSGWIEFFPAHPHEGAVDAPPGEEARAIAQGTSRSTSRRFNLAVAFERKTDGSGHRLGRGIAESSFHHFADYNWGPSRGCPSFVSEPAADGMRTNSRAASDIRAYVRNLARWLAPESFGADEPNISAPEHASAKEA